MYQNLVKMVKDAFEIDELVKVDCRELDRSDMKKIGAKLRVNPDVTVVDFQYTSTSYHMSHDRSNCNLL